MDEKAEIGAAVIRLALVLLCLLSSPAFAAGESVQVGDGDGLRLNGEKVRLWGVDAPEICQICELNGLPYPCGRTAADQLRTFTEGRNITCENKGRDRYGRPVVRCSNGAADLAALMVRSGWALEWKRYSQGAYSADQRVAQSARRGLWAGTFVLPSEWRRNGGRCPS